MRQIKWKICNTVNPKMPIQFYKVSSYDREFDATWFQILYWYMFRYFRLLLHDRCSNWLVRFHKRKNSNGDMTYCTIREITPGMFQTSNMALNSNYGFVWIHKKMIEWKTNHISFIKIEQASILNCKWCLKRVFFLNK